MAVTFSGQWERGIALVEKAYALNEASAMGWYHSAHHYDLYRRNAYRKALDAVRQHPVHERAVARGW